MSLEMALCIIRYLRERDNNSGVLLTWSDNEKKLYERANKFVTEAAEMFLYGKSNVKF